MVELSHSELFDRLEQVRQDYMKLDAKYQGLRAEHERQGEQLRHFREQLVSIVAGAEAQVDKLETENKLLRLALQEIVSASRDEGLSHMCNWMRGRAAAALDGDD